MSPFLAGYSSDGLRFKGPFAGLLVLIPVLMATAPAQATQHASARQATSPKLGSWVTLGLAQGGAEPQLLHTSNGDDLVIWDGIANGHDTWPYEYTYIKPYGGDTATPKDIFGGDDWASITAFPTLQSDLGQPLVMLEGGRTGNAADPYSRGCIVGDLLTSSGWKLQPWSLSASCYNPDHFGSTVTKNGTAAAAWPGGWTNGNGLLYRIGTSPAIPASGTDNHISTKVGDVGAVAGTTETTGQDIYSGYARFFSNPPSKDGLYVANLTKGTPPVKAPNTGTSLVAHEGPPVAIASPSVHGGVYAAYCNNVSPCSAVELWRYGSKTALSVPRPNSPTAVSLSAGPAGRLWVAWWSEQSGTVSVVRTNEAETKFGPVAKYNGPHGCLGDGNATIKISGGEPQRLDIALACYDSLATKGATHVSVTQSIVPLQVAATIGDISQKKGGSVTYRVSDVNDPVLGAKVKVDGKTATTDKKGQATFHFGKGSKTGSFKVLATAANYLSASTTLHITKP